MQALPMVGAGVYHLYQVIVKHVLARGDLLHPYMSESVKGWPAQPGGPGGLSRQRYAGEREGVVFGPTA